MVALRACIIVAALAGAAQAQTNGPMYPPTNNVTFTPSGASGRAGGASNSYTGMSMSGVTARWWGDNGSPIVNSLRNNTADTVTFNAALSDLSAGTAVFTGTTQLTFLNVSTFVTWPVDTRFTLRTRTLTDTIIPLALGSSLSPAPSTVPAVVAQVDADDFKALLLFEARHPITGGWTPTRDLFDALNTQPSTSTRTSFGGGFYEQIPAPGAATLLAAAGLGAARRRRR